MFRNTLTANDNYNVQDFWNLSSPIEMELYLKQTIFAKLFVSFLETTSNFKNFEKKDDRHSYFISEIKDCERLGQTTL